MPPDDLKTKKPPTDKFSEVVLCFARCGKCGYQMTTSNSRGPLPLAFQCLNDKCELYGVWYKVPRFPVERA